MSKQDWPVVCADCGATAMVEDYRPPVGYICTGCGQRKMRLKDDSEYLHRVMAPRYHDTVPERFPGKPDVIRRALDWKPTHERPALMLNGTPGRGKSRLMWSHVRSCIMRSERPVVFGAAVFSARIVAAWRDFTAESYVETLKRAPLVAFDDLDKESLTPRAEAALFAVFSHRCDWILPTIITANLRNDEDILGLFENQQTGAAFLRRLHEHAELIRP